MKPQQPFFFFLFFPWEISTNKDKLANELQENKERSSKKKAKTTDKRLNPAM